MATNITTAFWGMTINNPTDTDLVLVQNGYPDHMREIVHTIEEGEEGTTHIQAWIKLQRQQRLSFVKKLFPRASFQPLCNDEYIANTKKYAQKLDETAVSAAIHKFNDPIYTIENVTKRLLEGIVEELNARPEYASIEQVAMKVRKQMVAKDYRFAKIFVSSTFKQMWREYSEEMLEYYMTHTHTHTQSENISLPMVNASGMEFEETENDCEGKEDDSGTGGDGDGDEESACSSDEGCDESTDASDCSSYVSEEY